MGRYGQEWVRILGASGAIIIVTAFTWVYGKMNYIKVVYQHGRPPSYALPCALLQNWWLGLVIGILVAVTGGFAIVRHRHVTVAVICNVGWLLAISGVCLVLLAWQLEEIPITTPLR